MLVKDAMTPRPLSIDPDAPLETAIETMSERRIRHLPVVDDRGRLVGMLSDRDVRSVVVGPAIVEYLSVAARRRLRAINENIESLRVRDVMTWDVVTIGADAPVAQAAALMFEGRFGSLPVVSGGALVGIITEHDVLKALAGTLPAVRGLDPDTVLW